MFRFLSFGSILLTLALFSGCGSDRREAPVQNVITALNLSVENLKAIHTRLGEAEELKKKANEAGTGDTDAKENLNKKVAEVHSAIDDLKAQAQKLLDEMRRVEKDPISGDEEERKKLAANYTNRVADVLKAIAKEREELAKSWERAKVAFRDPQTSEEDKQFKDMRQKFKEAEGEFENLSRLRS